MRHFLFPCLFPLLVNSQSSFLKDSDIIWAKEIEKDWVVDMASFEVEQAQGVITRKLLRTATNEADVSNGSLSQLVFQAAEAGKIPVFSDPRCAHPLFAATALFQTDTVVSCFPSDDEEEKSPYSIVSFPRFKSEDVKAWRVREILAYRLKTASWTAYVESVAPIIIHRNDEGDSVGLKPVFWFKVGNKPMDLSGKHVVWAKQISSFRQADYFKMDEGTPVKIANGFLNPLEHQLKVFAADMNTPFYDARNEKILTPDERIPWSMIVIFDPVTYQEQVVEVINDINPDAFKNIRLVHQWYWDEKKSRLAIVLNAVAVMWKVYDKSSEFGKLEPLYYSRTGK